MHNAFTRIWSRKRASRIPTNRLSALYASYEQVIRSGFGTWNVSPEKSCSLDFGAGAPSAGRCELQRMPASRSIASSQIVTVEPMRESNVGSILLRFVD